MQGVAESLIENLAKLAHMAVGWAKGASVLVKPECSSPSINQAKSQDEATHQGICISDLTVILIMY